MEVILLSSQKLTTAGTTDIVFQWDQSYIIFSSSFDLLVVYCTLKDICSNYKAISKELTKEDLELKALEQATINAARRVQ